jgi:hypothetical protein
MKKKRLRCSISEEQWAFIEEVAKVFSVDPKIVLGFSTSIGLRFLDLSLVHPLTGLVKALDERADQTTAAILADVNQAIAQEIPVKPGDQLAEVAEESKKPVPRKRTAYKRR